jgi:hypothetical protein
LNPEAVVRQYLDAMERRDLAAARSLLAPGFTMMFPGGKRFDSLEQLVESARKRYGTLHGELLDGSPYSGIRFIDRFTVRSGKLVDQNVWNDMAEVLGAKLTPL